MRLTKKQRGKHEGSIFQRKRDGRWCAVVTVGGRRTMKLARTKQEATANLRTLMSKESNRSENRDAEHLALSAFLDSWLEKANVRSKTRRFYEDAINADITPSIGHLKLALLRPAHVETLLDSMRLAGRSPHLCRRAYVTLHAALASAIRVELVNRNVCDAVERPKVRRKPIEPLNAAHASALLNAALEEDDRRATVAAKAKRPIRLWATPTYPLLALALGTGLRFGEILGLLWRAVDLEAGTIEVQHRLDEVSRTLEATKTDSGRRRVALPPAVTAALQSLRKQQLARGPGSKYVFCNRDGGPLRQNNLARRVFKPLLRKAELPDVRFHDLRHSSATLALERGISPKVLQARLGHKSISTTMNIYGHVLPSMDREAADRLDDVFKRAK